MENKKNKICHVASADITIKFLLMGQLEFLKALGFDVYAVFSKGQWNTDIEKHGIKIKNIEIKRKIFTPLADLICFIKLFLYFKKEKFDIVHTHTPKPALLGQLAAKLAGAPIIINTIHGLYFTQDSSFLKRKFFIFIEKMSAECSDLIFSQNKEDIATLIKENIAKPEKIKYLGNGINLQKFNPQRFTEENIRQKKQELNLPPDYKIIGIVGRLVKEKGYFELFSALKEVLEIFPKTLLLAIGPQEPEKKDGFDALAVKEFGIEKNVIFLGQRHDLDQLYPVMDIFVLPSWREGFPRTIIEAMAMQKPIIATDIRGCREALENNKEGLLIPAKKSAKLAQALIFLLTNKQEAMRLAESAKIKAEKEFNEEFVFDKIKTEYQKLIKEKL